MRILLLTRSFNSLTQRLHVELAERGHDLSVEFDINDAVSLEAVDLFRPDLVIAPYLTRRIPEAIWRRVTTLVVHPGPLGDRGPSALDWAILDGQESWGVTLLQAEAELDAGPVWATRRFQMRAGTKSSLYRNEVTEAAVACVLEAIEALQGGRSRRDTRQSAEIRTAGWRRRVTQPDRAIDWRCDDTETVIRKIRAADGQPGVLDSLAGRPFHLYDAHPEPELAGRPGALLARRAEAVCRATADAAVWIGHLRPVPDGEPSFKRPATLALGPEASRLPERPPVVGMDGVGWQPIRYREEGAVGYLSFDFYNGAMSTAGCRRLLLAYRQAAARPTRVLVLIGGREFWSNGLDLATIEAAESPADESWRNINAMDDLTEAVIGTTDKLTVAAMRGNAGAGGVFLALAADLVLARAGIVLNPHYKNMGNLYGSEYWTYLLPRRRPDGGLDGVMDRRLPIGAEAARTLGLIDDVLPNDRRACEAAIEDTAGRIADDPAIVTRLADKARRRAADEAAKPLAEYRRAELERMTLNFYGFDPSYHVARYHFIAKLPLARTPVHLARHRELRRSSA
ncbi:MAG: hydrogenase maturation protein [Kiloniellales bacterium]|nr:hydrogenase maturation protein [Kiloniellales bacterium]